MSATVAPKAVTGPTVLDAPRKGQEHVFHGKSAQNEQFGTDSGLIRGQFGQKLSNNLLEMVTEIDSQQQSRNEKCQIMIEEMLCLPEIAKQFRATVKSNSGDYRQWITGITTMVQLFDSGELVKTTELVEKSSAADEILTKTFQQDKIKPILETYNILMKREDNTFRWATIEELEAQIQTLKPANDLQTTCDSETTKQQKPAFSITAICNKPIRIFNARRAQKTLAKAKADPFAKVTPDGQVQYLPKPFQDELSEKDKELLRRLAKAEAKEKLEGKLHNLNDKEFQREVRAAEKAAIQQAVAMHAEASVQAAEIAARRQVRNAKAAGYIPAAIGISAFSFAAFVIVNLQNGSTLDAGSTQYTVHQASMYQQPVYPEQEMMEMEETLKQIEAEVRAEEQAALAEGAQH